MGCGVLLGRCGEMQCFIITIHEHNDAIWNPPNFSPLVYFNEDTANKKCDELNAEVPMYSGYYFVVEDGTLIENA